jgi:hypothetical protein
LVGLKEREKRKWRERERVVTGTTFKGGKERIFPPAMKVSR